MPGEPIDYEAALADLEARRETFNAAIDNAKTSIQQILASERTHDAIVAAERRAQFYVATDSNAVWQRRKKAG